MQRKWPGWLFILLSVGYEILGFVSNLDFIIEKYNNPTWLAVVLSFLVNPPRIFSVALFLTGIAWLTYVYWWGVARQPIAEGKEFKRKHDLNVDAQGSLQILFEPDKMPYQDSWKNRSDSNGLVVKYSIGVKNLLNSRLEHCRVIISDISPKVKNLEIYGALNKIRHSPPPNETFPVNAKDIEFRRIVQFDELNGLKVLGGLGIELLTYSTEGYTNLPIDQQYVLTLQATCEIGGAVTERFEVGIEKRMFVFRKLVAPDC
jgi:hypothetical protein